VCFAFRNSNERDIGQHKPGGQEVNRIIYNHTNDRKNKEQPVTGTIIVNHGVVPWTGVTLPETHTPTRRTN